MSETIDKYVTYLFLLLSLILVVSGLVVITYRDLLTGILMIVAGAIAQPSMVKMKSDTRLLLTIMTLLLAVLVMPVA